MSADIDEQAARWHGAQVRDDMDWAAFTDWLEADPRHRAAFDAIALLDEKIVAARPPLIRLVGEAPPPRRLAPRVAAVAAVVVALIGLIAVGFVQFATRPATRTIAYAAPAGHSREVRLADGLVATLAPGSTLTVADGRAAPITLDGRAYFDVRHDAAQPLTVRVGGYEVRDVGTRFDVSAAAGTVRVAVAEGRVAVAGAGKLVEIGPGEAVTAQSGSALEKSRTDIGTVGRWRSGPLDYDQVPLAIVAADIARFTGRTVTIDPAAGRRRFSGVIAPGDRAAMVGSLAALTGLETQMVGDAVHIGAGAGR